MIQTEYYNRDIPDDYGGPIPNGNYKSQDLFCLSTRMYPVIHKLLGPDIKISYNTSDAPENNEHGKHRIFLELSRGGKVLTDLSDSDIKSLQAAVSRFTADPEQMCLVFGANATIFDDRGRKISSIWIRSMLGYIDLPAEYNAKLDNSGILAKIPENTAPETGYEQFQVQYHKLMNDIVKLLQQMYNQGYTVTTPEMANRWNLKLMPGTEELYKPNWIDGRITGDEGVNTFLNRVFRSRFHIRVGYNKVVRHQIAVKLGDTRYSFEDDQLITRVKSFEAVVRIAALVHLSLNVSTGRVLRFSYYRSIWTEAYTKAANELFPESSSIVYSVDGKQVFSCLRSLTKPSIDEQLELRNRAQAIFEVLISN